jgi:uncharacterized protein (DUF488 family)
MPERRQVRDSVPTTVIREGGRVTLFTIGYEKRTGKELIGVLRRLGVEHLADVRKKPISRKADFRAKALAALCAKAGIEYGPWPELGATEAMRDRLHATGDLGRFHKEFGAYARKRLKDPVKRLAAVAKRKKTALLCYERAHEECHRREIAEMVAEEIGAGVVAVG